jgi:hypothetical protein
VSVEASVLPPELPPLAVMVGAKDGLMVALLSDEPPVALPPWPLAVMVGVKVRVGLKVGLAVAVPPAPPKPPAPPVALTSPVEKVLPVRRQHL